MSSLDTAWWIFPWHGGGCGPGESMDHHGMVWHSGPGKCLHGREVDGIPQRGVCALPCGGVQQCNSLQSFVPATKGHFLHFTIGSILTVHHCLDRMCATSPPSSMPSRPTLPLSPPPLSLQAPHLPPLPPPPMSPHPPCHQAGATTPCGKLVQTATKPKQIPNKAGSESKTNCHFQSE